MATTSLCLVVALPSLITSASQRVETITIERALDTLYSSAHVHYREQVLTTRCLPQSTLAIADLSLPANDGVAGYSISYRQDTSTNTPPLGFEVTVTLNDDTYFSALSRHLQPTQLASPNTLIFHEPLRFELPDWAQWNTSTGCLQ
ncbi:hypothetical protein [Vibrio maritimus]|uniref:hypothetical protein n=1 Tax=Vibrio maritimus TaxID=990268 RepID=UPI001F17BD27|nr:hypothetical protein [Vibrio maritimus]